MGPRGVDRESGRRGQHAGLCTATLALTILVAWGQVRSAPTFVRGDCNDDTTVDISDPIMLLEYLFLRSSEPVCLKAADVTDDGGLDIADPVFLLFALFGDGYSVSEPYPEAGVDPTGDALSCREVPIPGHEGITEYAGPATCVGCHRDVAEDVHASVHYQLSGPTPKTTNIEGSAGKGGEGSVGYNTYCGSIVTSRQAVCGGCHIGNGRKPSATLSDAQLANIDCLMCHQDDYRRRPAGPLEELAAKKEDGSAGTVLLPQEDSTGFDFVPDQEKMPISILQAVRTVHLPTRQSCLKCHGRSGGADGAKRGDLSSASAAPAAAHDTHMSPQTRDFRCQRCHEFEDHRLLGRGLDLRPSDRSESLECTNCHESSPHDSSTTNRHLGRVACQTCHISEFARDIATEVARDWESPVWEPGVLGGQGGWKPESGLESDVTPSYRWYDGTSEVYVLGEAAWLNGNGEYALSSPNGDLTSPGAKLYPMKEHRGVGALHEATGQLIPHSTLTYFLTGDFAAAVEDGMAQVGLSGDWTTVELHAYQAINHGVAPHNSALDCEDCHVPLAGGSPTRLDLEGEMGYELKADRRTVCSQSRCHGYESSNSFTWVHSKHVASRGYDCSWCHNFSRPERGLRMP